MSKQELLRKYLAGNCSPKELRRLYDYLSTDEATDYEPLLAEVWEQLQTARSPSAAASDRIYAGVTKQVPALNAPTNRRRWLVAAAAVTGLLLIGWLAQPLLLPSYVTYQTSYAEVQHLVLPDGTVVDLNANSSLRVTTRTNDEPREAWLTGEAYFHVAPRQSREDRPIKFVVHTSNLDVEVLGTTFNVKDRRGTTDVVLSSGSILLRKQANQAQAVAMKPGDRVRLHQAEKFELTHVPEPIVYTSWKDNELYFDDQPLVVIQQELADSYNIMLRFANPTLAELRFTGSAPADDPVILLQTIQKSFDLTLNHNADGYLLTP